MCGLSLLFVLFSLIHHRLTLDLWFAKDNRFLNPKSSYKRILMAPPCRLIPFVLHSNANCYIVFKLEHHSILWFLYSYILLYRILGLYSVTIVFLFSGGLYSFLISSFHYIISIWIIFQEL